MQPHQTFVLSLFIAIALQFVGGSASILNAAEKPISFRSDVQPILALNCLRCHGPDEETQEGGLRFDLRDAAIQLLESGEHAIIPGKPEKSEMIARITTDDDSLMMPPEETGQKLTAKDIAILKRWVKEGAEYETHWSFEAPKKSETPLKISQPKWIQNDLDRLVLSRLDQEKLTPNPEAKKEVLIRRASLLLTGLPATPEEVKAFIDNESEFAYEKVIDRLLNSPSYGERWARVWLDLARYADSAGYAQDPARNIWRYRDWVIQAINQNMPYDQFTIEQLAGDLLPDANESQRLATAFHRNTMTNSEGGTDDEEFRNAAVIDRVNTTLQVWMGLTMGCAQCHTHKYDPITQKEYFQVFAIFNNSADADKGDESPNLVEILPHQLEQKQKLREKISKTQHEIERKRWSLNYPDIESNKEIKTRFVRVQNLEEKSILSLAEVEIFATNSKGELENIARKGIARQSSSYQKNNPKKAIDGNTDGDFNTALSTTHTNPQTNPWWEVDLKSAQQIQKIILWNRTDGITGQRLKNFRIVGMDKQRNPLWATYSSAVPKPSFEYKTPQNSTELSNEEKELVFNYYFDESTSFAKETKLIATTQRQLESLKTLTPIMQELPKDKHRKTFIQIRGNFMDTGEEVSQGLLGAFHPLDDSLKNKDLNRLTFSHWLLDKKNPLTSRVVVNRYWEHLFGRGLVTTSEDFGIQGERPVQQELLDYLAIKLIEDKWDTKKLVRHIVTSATFRQSSYQSPALLEKDPDNRLFSRGPQFRLPAEMIRDNALAISGLLSRKMYGPSVKPRRPNLGLRAAFGGSTDWKTSDGEDQFRRGLYTSWRRTTPYPSMATFDAPSREVCTIRRIRTNTPLQALVTLNDPVFVEAAQALGRRVLKEKSKLATKQQIEYAFQLCLSRTATKGESKRLVQLYDNLKTKFESDPNEAKLLATDPIGPAPKGVSLVELATWTALSNVLLNLDETLSVY